MAKHYQVVHMGGIMAFSTGEAKEHQRLYSEKEWQNLDRSKRSTATIDRSRAHLNFEIGKGGKIYPLGTLPPVTKRYQQRLAEAKAIDPNQKCIDAHKDPAYRTVCEIIFSGDVDVMRNFAFGDQKVDFGKVDATSLADIANSPNARVVRMHKIEQWAIDMYNAVAHKYGEDNIIGFSVHLDESEPHIHCCITPVYPFEKHYKNGSVKKGNKIKYRETFGGNRNVLGQLHDYFYSEVNCHYGLDRGESVNETGARHIDKAEYMRSLNRRISETEELIAQKEKALKGLTTMIENLEKEKDAFSSELDSVRKQIEEGNGNMEELQEKLDKLNAQLSGVNDKLTSKRERLMDVEAALSSYRELHDKQQESIAESEAQVATAKEAVAKCKTEFETFRQNFTANGCTIAKAMMFEQAMHEFSQYILPNLKNGIDDIEDTLFDDVYYNRINDVIDTAADAIIRGIGKSASVALEAIGGKDYVMSSGGGGGSDSKGWGKDKDENDWDYVLRMIRMSHNAHYPGNRKRGGYHR